MILVQSSAQRVRSWFKPASCFKHVSDSLENFIVLVLVLVIVLVSSSLQSNTARLGVAGQELLDPLGAAKALPVKNPAG